MRTRTAPGNAENGIVLIETLIALLLFSFGVLGLVGMQAAMVRDVTQSKLRAEASFLANQLIGQMWVDPANLGNYAISNGSCAASDYDPCANWRNAVSQTLPAGSADVAVSGTSVDITLTWQLAGEAAGRYEISAIVSN